jgi:cytochrome c
MKMSFAKIGMAALVGLMVSGIACAAGEVDLATKSGCLACHAVDHKVIGPAYKDVAAKYKGDAAAATKLYAKVKAGGSGVWGQIPMPPNAQVSDGNIKTLVDWVLTQK